MQVGMIGLGRMGGNMVRRLLRGGHTAWPSTRTPDVAALAEQGAVGATSIEDFMAKLQTPRVVWLMVPQKSSTRFSSRPSSGATAAWSVRGCST